MACTTASPKCGGTNDRDLVRVVHYPGEPFDLGVVKRARDATGALMPGRFVVLWATGEKSPIKGTGHLPESPSDELHRVVTVSRRREHCRRIYALAEAAFESAA